MVIEWEGWLDQYGSIIAIVLRMQPYPRSFMVTHLLRLVLSLREHIAASHPNAPYIPTIVRCCKQTSNGIGAIVWSVHGEIGSAIHVVLNNLHIPREDVSRLFGLLVVGMSVNRGTAEPMCPRQKGNHCFTCGSTAADEDE